MVESHGGITLATLRDVNLDKRCVALPRYIVYVYIYRDDILQSGPLSWKGNREKLFPSLMDRIMLLVGTGLSFEDSLCQKHMNHLLS